MNKGLKNLEHLRDRGEQVNRKLPEVERVSHNCALSQDALDRLQKPTVADGQRASALRFGDTRAVALLHALCLFFHLTIGFRNRDPRERHSLMRTVELPCVCTSQSVESQSGDANRQQKPDEHASVYGANRGARLGDEIVFSLLGGSDALRSYTRSLHRGSRAWPETMDMEWGFFTEQSHRAVADAHRQSSFEIRFIAPKRLFEMILQVTGMDCQSVTMSVMGPRANPARRFAV